MGGYAEISQRGKAAVENVQRSTSDVRRRSCGGSALPCSVLAGCMLPPLLGLVITHAERARVPKGRLRSNPTAHPSAVPSGLVCMRHVSRRSNAGLFSKCPSGTKKPGGRLFRQERNPIHERCLQGHFAVSVSRQEDVGHDHAYGVQGKNVAHVRPPAEGKHAPASGGAEPSERRRT